jgi:hypothetical protein
MAHWIVQHTKAGTPRPHGLREQASAVLRAALGACRRRLSFGCIPGRAMAGWSAVGLATRVFVGDAVISAAYPRFIRDEADRMPGFSRSTIMGSPSMWPRPVSVMAVWPNTLWAATNSVLFGSPRSPRPERRRRHDRCGGFGEAER